MPHMMSSLFRMPGSWPTQRKVEMFARTEYLRTNVHAASQLNVIKVCLILHKPFVIMSDLI